ncbi:hypothetical protein AB1Y20_014108 [Prymnesium parvum]|uniref:Sugar phosphate transporter domain-containing protein n=1 Tax=Prymnesium parvum TaxID=97485 RepID=A0AB34IGZ6_PRYPA|mmetsp:Transcript_17328/g.43554  ORF Transcript_17328/g.43554 Transcript_17328/m.43554 type:complete len:373 (-) Transcript_17328:15-1133(-)
MICRASPLLILALLSAHAAAASLDVKPSLVRADLPRSRPALAAAPSTLLAAKPAPTPPPPPVSAVAKLLASVDVPLLLCFAFWYLGNYYYTLTNKKALIASGGSSGFPMTISTMQLGVGVVYALLSWLTPLRALPKVTSSDLISMLPVAFCAAAAHSFSVFAQSAGAVSFAMIVKAAEPAFAAVLGTFLYGKTVSKAKWLCLIPVIGGVILASVKELDFAWSALITASLANLFAAFKGNENKKLMETPGIKDRLGSVGNQFALTTILAFLISIPFMIAKESSKWGDFVTACKSTPAVYNNLIASGLLFYMYNELATMTIKKTSATTQSVANTAKRVIVIVGSAIVFGESVKPMKMLGCTIGIGGVFLYSMVK